MSAASGEEIAKHRTELDAVLLKIMREHTERCKAEGEQCEWWQGEERTLKQVRCDLEEVLERYHLRRKAAA